MLKRRSITGRAWQIPEAPAPGGHLDEHDSFCEIVLRNRGCDLQFINTNPALPDQKKLQNLEPAVQLTLQAIKDKRHLVLIGDYDADGVTATALLYRYMDHLEMPCQVHIPNRITDGYGQTDLTKFPRDSLFFALDWGTTTPMEGIETIVLDHHKADQASTSLVINPHLDGCKEFQNLSAVGVTFFFLAEVSNQLRSIGIKPMRLGSAVDLVAIGTICDVMPMNDPLNRYLVRQGLKILNQETGNKGVQTLLRNTSPPYNEESISFDVGPKINASSRMKTADLAFDLLTTENQDQAEMLAEQLTHLNQSRKEVQKQTQKEAIEDAYSQRENGFILVAREHWHLGVIGVVAGQLLNTFSNSKPVLVAGKNNRGLWQGSARSTSCLDIGQLVREATAKGILTSGGGHKKAAGFTLEHTKLSQFEGFLVDSVPKGAAKPYLVDEITTIRSLRRGRILKALVKLAPFGEEYRPPLVMVKRVKPKQVKEVNAAHIRFLATSDLGDAIWVWAFFAARTPLGDALHSQRVLDMLLQITPEYWRNELIIKAKLVDVA